MDHGYRNKWGDNLQKFSKYEWGTQNRGSPSFDIQNYFIRLSGKIKWVWMYYLYINGAEIDFYT